MKRNHRNAKAAARTSKTQARRRKETAKARAAISRLDSIIQQYARLKQGYDSGEYTPPSAED
jgi:hypothetical protein